MGRKDWGSRGYLLISKPFSIRDTNLLLHPPRLPHLPGWLLRLQETRGWEESSLLRIFPNPLLPHRSGVWGLSSMVMGFLTGQTMTMLPRSPEIVMGEERLGGRGPLPLRHSQFRKRNKGSPLMKPLLCAKFHVLEIFHKVPVRHSRNTPRRPGLAWRRRVSLAELEFAPSLCELTAWAA